jgi:pyruvate-formate lyase
LSLSHTGINLIIDNKLDNDFRKKSAIMLRSEVQLPGFTEDEAMVPIDVFRMQQYFCFLRNHVRSVQDSQKDSNLMQQVETGLMYNCVSAE